MCTSASHKASACGSFPQAFFAGAAVTLTGPGNPANVKFTPGSQKISTLDMRVLIFLFTFCGNGCIIVNEKKKGRYALRGIPVRRRHTHEF